MFESDSFRARLLSQGKDENQLFLMRDCVNDPEEVGTGADRDPMRAARVGSW